MANWNNPTNLSLYTDVIADLKSRDSDAYTLAESPTNPPTGAIRFNRTDDRFEEWDGASWVTQVLSITGGGTGAITAGGARTALGLGTMATQNSNAVSISGGSITGLSDLGVSGNLTLTGLITVGSGPTTITNTSGQILESAIADANILARRASTETISAVWTFNSNPVFNNNAIPETKIADGSIFPRLAANESISGIWTFSTNPVFNAGAIPETALADGSVYPRIGATETITATWTYANPIVGSITGNAATASALSPGNTINGVTFTGAGAITVAAAAGTLTGSTLASGVTASSLTSVGVLSQVRVGNGDADNPALAFNSVADSGAYYNPSNPSVEFGIDFQNVNNARAAMRAVGSPGVPKVDFLIGSTFSIEITNGAIRPPTDNSTTVGDSSHRFSVVYATNGTIQTSDIRHKKVISQINAEEALDAICALDTFTARFNHDKTEKDIFPALSAQDVKAVLDDQFGTNVVLVDQFDMHNMYYDRIIPFLCASIRGLRAEVQRLRPN